ncbi:rhomboid family intramembrane serine protease [Streptomyces sp. NPDC059166]|uniref:rhomboid family intramembrane serine protease n=1 Tax=Streptomyces sp. NPDC059166 TaxID=3346752 RepID=UPI0036C7E238
MNTHTLALYACAAAVVVPGTRIVVEQLGGDRIGPRRLLVALWRPIPMAAAVMVGVMAAMAVVQTVVPGAVPRLERSPDGGPWRVVTALLVQTSGWGQLLFNLAALAVVAAAAERRLGSLWMPVVFLVSGVAAHVVSTLGWSVHGGGDSVGICGLVGALAACDALGTRQRTHRMAALLVPVSGVALCLMQNNHSVGVLTGAVLGAALHSATRGDGPRWVAARSQESAEGHSDARFSVTGRRHRPDTGPYA